MLPIVENISVTIYKGCGAPRHFWGLVRVSSFCSGNAQSILQFRERPSILTLSFKSDLGLNVIIGKTIVMINLSNSSVTQSEGY